MTTETPRAESLQEIERLVDACVDAIDGWTGIDEVKAPLMSAIQRVVMERDGLLEMQEDVHRICREMEVALYGKDAARQSSLCDIQASVTREVPTLRERIAVLEKALRKYGWHNDDCPVLAICQHDNFKDSITCDHDKRCTCGYSAALAEVGQMEGK